MIKNEKDIDSDSSVDLPEVSVSDQATDTQDKMATRQDGQQSPELGLTPIQATQLPAANDAPGATTTASQQPDPLFNVNPPKPATNTDDNNSGQPLVADDVDLIEKEWVEKAKQIVNQTKDDPHTQNKELNSFKADYIKKRYNKESIVIKE